MYIDVLTEVSSTVVFLLTLHSQQSAWAFVTRRKVVRGSFNKVVLRFRLVSSTIQIFSMASHPPKRTSSNIEEPEEQGHSQRKKYYSVETDLWTDEEHRHLDSLILKIAPNVEEIDNLGLSIGVMTEVGIQITEKCPDALGVTTITRKVKNEEELRSLVEEAWRKKSFKALRNLGECLLFRLSTLI